MKTLETEGICRFNKTNCRGAVLSRSQSYFLFSQKQDKNYRFLPLKGQLILKRIKNAHRQKIGQIYCQFYTHKKNPPNI